MNVKRLLPVVGMLLLAVMLVCPVSSKAEMYIEGYLGLNAAAPVGKESEWRQPNTGASGTFDFSGTVNAAFQGGFKLGYWFVKEGFGGANYPDWAKYFGLYFDLSYHHLDIRRETATITQQLPVFAVNTVGENNIYTEGTALTLAFMFAARYGFLPDSEVPFGRLQPYIAVGPAILISSQRPTIDSAYVDPRFPALGGGRVDFESKTVVNVALAVETGLRYMCLKNVSLEASFKYRYAAPSYNLYGEVGNRTGNVFPVNANYKPTYNLLSFQFGAAYHF